MHQNLHATLDVLDDIGAIFQLVEHVDAFNLGILLVLQRMLKRCPKVHCYRAQLDFNRHILFPIKEINRHLHDDMKAAVSVWLGVRDVVLHLHDLQIVLQGKNLQQGAHIVDIGNDYTHARNVQDVFLHGFQRYRNTVTIQFVIHAFGCLDTRFNVMDRVAA